MKNIKSIIQFIRSKMYYYRLDSINNYYKKQWFKACRFKKPKTINSWCEDFGVVEYIEEIKYKNNYYKHHYAYGYDYYYKNGKGVY